ncbi:hypothetical protein ZOSMA_222G00290 [Zostera marina]|uniref:Uncharacterized protein n=1 Tax=Zostera marina TaxID=29655 RepID=A0A0K9PJE5_ZOSMR|nr:hypothetical protein ZOSMA_222G00290 [Zostera marina]
MARSAILIAIFFLSVSLVSFSDAEKQSEISIAELSHTDLAVAKTLSASYIPVRKIDLFHIHKMKGDPKSRFLQRQNHFKIRNLDWDNTLGKEMDGKMVHLTGCGGVFRFRGRRMGKGLGFHHTHHHHFNFLHGPGEYHRHQKALNQLQKKTQKKKIGLVNWFRDFLN